ncbi:hypothetical protein ACGFJ7_46135 [Actinoplanes sp. NPDC048988]|uniref:hypothetical protein n=1 Tax=Actinoplanes sp. NPDC048988 TaxID=3363901 RepID=UPI00371C5AB4
MPEPNSSASESSPGPVDDQRRSNEARSALLSEAAETFFAEQLHKLGLSHDQVEAQKEAELKTSLAVIDDALQHPDSFGTITVDITPQTTRIDLPGTGIDTLAKGLGVVGIAAFAILFAAYYQFYSTVGVRPEDIGVSYTYVVTRSFGMAFVLIAAVAYAEYPLVMNATMIRRSAARRSPPSCSDSRRG